MEPRISEICLVIALALSAIVLNLFHVPVFTQVIVYVLIFIPYFVKRVKEYLEEEELEYNFPIFLRDLAQYLEIGQPIPVALRSVKENNYGKKLNYEIRKMLSEMEFGLTFVEAFERMANRVKSDKVKKTIFSIIEAEKYGGDMKGLLQNLSKSLEELMEIKRERISHLKNFMFVYYGVFFGLLLTIVLVTFFINKFFTKEINPQILAAFKNVAFILAILNALFTGIVIGKVSTGKCISGITHSIVLLVITAIVMSFI